MFGPDRCKGQVVATRGIRANLVRLQVDCSHTRRLRTPRPAAPRGDLSPQANLANEIPTTIALGGFPEQVAMLACLQSSDTLFILPHSPPTRSTAQTRGSLSLPVSPRPTTSPVSACRPLWCRRIGAVCRPGLCWLAAARAAPRP